MDRRLYPTTLKGGRLDLCAHLKRVKIDNHPFPVNVVFFKPGQTVVLGEQVVVIYSYDVIW